MNVLTVYIKKAKHKFSKVMLDHSRNIPGQKSRIKAEVRLAKTNIKQAYVHGSLDNGRVYGGHSVDSVRADDGQVGHVESLLRELFHDGHATDASHLSREPCLHLLGAACNTRRGKGGSNVRCDTP